jgi:hypothetical protein
VQSIYYNDYNNTFEDDFGCIFYNISELLPSDEIIKYKQVGGTYYSTFNGETIEIDFPIRDNYILIAYYQETNTFMDEDDNIIVNIFSLIPANELFMFKRNKKNAVIKGNQDRIIDLLYI